MTLIFGKSKSYGRSIAGIELEGKDCLPICWNWACHLFVIPPDEADHTNRQAADARQKGRSRHLEHRAIRGCFSQAFMPTPMETTGSMSMGNT